MAVPDFQSFMLPLLNFTADRKEPTKTKLSMHSHAISTYQNPMERDASKRRTHVCKRFDG